MFLVSNSKSLSTEVLQPRGKAVKQLIIENSPSSNLWRSVQGVMELNCRVKYILEAVSDLMSTL